MHSLITQTSATVHTRKIFGGEGRFVVNHIRIIAQCSLRNDMSQITEYEAVTTFHFMLTFEDTVRSFSIDLDDGGCHDSKAETGQVISLARKSRPTLRANCPSNEDYFIKIAQLFTLLSEENTLTQNLKYRTSIFSRPLDYSKC
jgi:hypothetical protein